jgi:hypothetical protein
MDEPDELAEAMAPSSVWPWAMGSMSRRLRGQWYLFIVSLSKEP